MNTFLLPSLNKLELNIVIYNCVIQASNPPETPTLLGEIIFFASHLHSIQHFSTCFEAFTSSQSHNSLERAFCLAPIENQLKTVGHLRVTQLKLFSHIFHMLNLSIFHLMPSLPLFVPLKGYWHLSEPRWTETEYEHSTVPMK